MSDRPLATRDISELSARADGANVEPNVFNALPLDLIEAAEARNDAARGFEDATVIHDEIQDIELDTRSQAMEAVASADLLETLANMGFLWSLVARVVGVSPTAVRKWRRGEPVTPPNHKSIADLVAFCTFLHQVSPKSQGQIPYWLETPVVSDTTLTRLALYLAGHRIELLNIAADRLSSRAALDRVMPGWQQSFSRDTSFRTVFDDDGMPTIVKNSEGDLGGGG